MKLTETKSDMQGMICSVNGDDHFMDRITSIGIKRERLFRPFGTTEKCLF